MIYSKWLRRKSFCCATIEVIIPGCKLEADLTSAWHLEGSLYSRGEKLFWQVHFPQTLPRQTCVCFCTSLLWRTSGTAICFSGLRWARSGFNHETPLPVSQSRAEIKLWVNLWCPCKHARRRSDTNFTLTRWQTDKNVVEASIVEIFLNIFFNWMT